MKIFISLLLTLLVSAPLAAETALTENVKRDIDISRKLINEKRVKALAVNMHFTEQEKKAFWPLWEEYRTAMRKVGDERLAIIINYADHLDSMTDKIARQLLDSSFDVDRKEIKVREKYAKKFRRILPDTKVARLMQIEHRIDALVDLKIAEGVPLME
jgi:hypothetical protein